MVAEAYDLTLVPPSNQGYDAVSKHGDKVEIKATQAKSVAFRSSPERCIVIRILPDGTFQEVYNGAGARIWKNFEGKKLPSNGQFKISLTRLSKLQAEVSENEKIYKTSN
jgi:hypothetical protein